MKVMINNKQKFSTQWIFFSPKALFSLIRSVKKSEVTEWQVL